MGPTGIKIGQVLSHRIDILPQNICIILSKLTDNLPGIGMNQEKKFSATFCIFEVINQVLTIKAPLLTYQCSR